MRRMWIFWTLAVVVTLSAAVYQRLTGPTHPRRGSVAVDGELIRFRLPRSGTSGTDRLVLVETGRPDLHGTLAWRRYRSNDPWTSVPLTGRDGSLSAVLPHQPPAGKLEYRVAVGGTAGEVRLTPEPVVIRFKGAVPTWVLVPHVLFIFAAMLISNLAGLLAVTRHPLQRKWGLAAFWLLLAGGMILGPVVQKYAFGEFWTGVPWGWDLTDNKTLIGFLGWLVAVLANRRHQRPGWTAAAALLLLVVFSIPHSMFGSELDYQTGVIGQG